jgi:hypothetical protein
MAIHVHVHVHAQDTEFKGSEQQWVEQVKAKHGYATFRPRLGVIYAKSKEFKTVGIFDPKKNLGTID